MKKYVLILCLFFAIISNAQKEKETSIKFNDGIFNNSILLNKKLSEKWSIHTGLDISYNFDANNIQLPLHLKYKVNKKLSVFAGPQLYHAFNVDHYNNTPKSSIFGVSAELGVQYDFSEDAFLRVSHQYNFTAKKYNDLGLSSEKRLMNFKVGYKF